MSDMIKLSLAEVRCLAEGALMGNGCDMANAVPLVETITIAERDGSASHGLFRLPGYIASLRSGKVNGKSRPVVTQPAPGVVHVDNDNGYAPLGVKAGRKALIMAAKSQGIACMVLINSYHFAALWPEVEPLADAGLCGFACTTANSFVAPAGGAQALFSTNPIAFGWPRRDAPPMVFDMATSAMARGEIQLAARDKHNVPLGTGLDNEGLLTTDPQAILDGGVQLPFGGYKGSAIAMMVELLSAGLTGERFSFEASEADNNDGGPPRGGEFILAIDPSQTTKGDWRAHSEQLFQRMLAMDGVRLPGDRRYRNRTMSSVEGIEIPSNLYNKIVALTPQS